MNTFQFISGIREAVYAAAFHGVTKALKNPPGRNPDPLYVRLSAWYQGLAHEDQAMVSEVAKAAALQTTYNFLLVLDGSLAFEPTGEKGTLELFHTKSGASTLLNDPENDHLSALFKNLAQA